MEKMIHVFRTNISDQLQRETLREIFEQVQEVVEWSVDLEDCDKVLRVVSTGGSAEEFIIKVQNKGFFCEELD